MRFVSCYSFSCYGYQALKQNKNVGVNRKKRKYICILTALNRPQHISKYHVEFHVFSSNYIFYTSMKIHYEVGNDSTKFHLQKHIPAVSKVTLLC